MTFVGPAHVLGHEAKGELDQIQFLLGQVSRCLGERRTEAH